MIKEKRKVHRINVRLTDEQHAWYVKQAAGRDIVLSEFIRLIPTMIKQLNESLDDKDDKIIELEKENIKLRARIFSLKKNEGKSH